MLECGTRIQLDCVDAGLTSRRRWMDLKNVASVTVTDR